MSGNKVLSGSCLCGGVKFTATPEKAEMGICHCSMCRRWTGGVFMAVTCTDGLTLADDSQLGVYKSSEWGERCFCKTCGTTLFWRMQGGGHVAVSAQAFDDPAQFAFTSQIFIDEKPANYDFANDTKNMTGAEVIALFTSN